MVFVNGKIMKIPSSKMDDDWGYPHGKPHILPIVNLQSCDHFSVLMIPIALCKPTQTWGPLQMELQKGWDLRREFNSKELSMTQWVIFRHFT